MTARTPITRTAADIALRARVGLAAMLLVVLAGCGGGGGGGAPASADGGNQSPGADCGAGYYWTGSMCAHEPLPYDDSAAGPSGVPASGSDTNSCFDFTMFGPIVGPDCTTEDFFSYPDEDAALAMSTLNYVLDVEPNDDLATAAVVAIDATLLGGMQHSVATFGTLSAASDRVDNYVFTMAEAGQIGIELCVDDLFPCGQHMSMSNLSVDIAHIEILSQFGELLATTSSDSEVGNYVVLPVDSGLPYYVSVVGGDLAESQSYYLRLTRIALDTATTSDEPAKPNSPTFSFYNEGFFGVDTGMSATFYWTAPTLNTDGTPLLDLQGYVLYYGLVPEGPDGYLHLVYDHSVPLDVGLSAYTVTVPEHGHWSFALTAVNAQGIESERSMAIGLTVAAPESL